MKVKVERYEFTQNSTIGRLSIDGKEMCFTLEDMVRPDKVYGETCIPLGTYDVKLRKAGTMYHDYLKKFKSFFKGSLHIVGIPGYEFVLIHIGNEKKDTLGCILVGMSPGIDRVDASTDAFKLIYPIILDAIEKGDKVTIEICNEVTK